MGQLDMDGLMDLLEALDEAQILALLWRHADCVDPDGPYVVPYLLHQDLRNTQAFDGQSLLDVSYLGRIH